jgi:hypothetical protein
MPKRYLVTCGLPYSNNRLHVGHIAGAYLPADTFVRYLRACGQDRALHLRQRRQRRGDRNLRPAEANHPQEISTHYHDYRKQDFEALGIEFDVYGGTHHRTISRRTKPSARTSSSASTTRATSPRSQPSSFTTPRPSGSCRTASSAARAITAGDADANGDQCDNCGNMIDPLLLKNPVSKIAGQAAEVRETTHWYLRLSSLRSSCTLARIESWDQWRSQRAQLRAGPDQAGAARALHDARHRVGRARAARRSRRGRARCSTSGSTRRSATCRSQPAGASTVGERGTTSSGGRARPDHPLHRRGQHGFSRLDLAGDADGRRAHQFPYAVVANNFLNQQARGPRPQDQQELDAAGGAGLDRGVCQEGPRSGRAAVLPDRVRPRRRPAPRSTQGFHHAEQLELVAALGNFVNRADLHRQVLRGRCPMPRARTIAIGT